VDFELLDAGGGLTGFLCRIHGRRQVVVLLDVIFVLWFLSLLISNLKEVTSAL